AVATNGSEIGRNYRVNGPRAERIRRRRLRSALWRRLSPVLRVSVHRAAHGDGEPPAQRRDRREHGTRDRLEEPQELLGLPDWPGRAGPDTAGPHAGHSVSL